MIYILLKGGRRQVVRQWIVTPLFAGSNPVVHQLKPLGIGKLLAKLVVAKLLKICCLVKFKKHFFNLSNSRVKKLPTTKAICFAIKL